MAAMPVLVAMILAMVCATSLADGGWRSGRATRYGGLDDPWSIHTGSCGYGYLDWRRATGWDVAAPSDCFPGVGSGGCGRCLEIKCRNAMFTDNYHEQMDRSSACYGQDASVVVMVTDSCPCNYPANAYSNKRWCCGDMDHLDLSQWAFEKLAASKWGVIGISYREVACDYLPSNQAQLPSGAQPSAGYAPPPGWQPQYDRRPWPWSQS